MVMQGESHCCGISSTKILVTYRYAEGSILYDCHKARKGVLYVVVIKSVKLITNNKTFGKTIPLYTDTFNALWNENELCTEGDAKILARAYLVQQQQKILDLMNKC